MLDWAMNQTDHPVAVRIPRLKVVETGKTYPTDYSALNTFSLDRKGEKVAIIAAGAFYQLGEQCVKTLVQKGYNPTLINPRYLSGLDDAMLDSLKKDHNLVITLEDGVLDGGFGEKVARYYGTSDMMVKCYGMKKEFADRYDYAQILQFCGLTPDQISKDVDNLLK